MWSLLCPKCERQRNFKHYASFWAAKKNASVCHSCAGYSKKPGVRMSSGEISDILRLHATGETNRGIAKQLQVHHNTVAVILKKHGLICNGPKRKSLERLGNGTARCSKCGGIKPETEFTINRRGKKYEYPMSYCSECRRKRDYLITNASTERYVHRIFLHLKRRAKRLNVPCTIVKDHIWKLYQTQEGKCFYTDVLMRCQVGNGSSRESLSIDKVEPNLGYIAGNIVLFTRRANTIKSDMTLVEMREWMPSWYARVEKFRYTVDR